MPLVWSSASLLLGTLLATVVLPIAGQLPRTIHEPDLQALVQRVLTDTYTVDPLLTAYLAHPSPFYTDLYGIHALKDFTAQQLINHFVPNNASLVKQTNSTVELLFSTGWNATFYPHAALVIKNATSPTDHVYVGGNNASELIRYLTDFHHLLKRNNLESTYLIPNPHYELEKQVDRAYYSESSPVKVKIDPTMSEFQAASNALMIYPDPVHGDRVWYSQFMEALQSKTIDWLGLEMLTSSMQPTLDAFCLQPNTSAAYIAARTNLTGYFLHGWTDYFRLNITSGEDSPYFQAVDLIRRKGGRVYGLDFDDMNFIFFRNGESDFGAAVRSLNWANSLPTKGRGIVFGGSAHFTSRRPVNVQDFLASRDANVKLFSVRTLWNAAAASWTINTFLIFASLSYVFVQ